jgi:periplasmic copper chaperone A
MMRLIAALLLLLPMPAFAHEFQLDGLDIIHPSIPATPIDGTTAHIYMAIVNDGTAPERLLGIETPFGPATLERMAKGPDGQLRAEPMAWIDLPVGETVLLTAGELRGRVEGVTTPLVDGGQLDGTFVFEKRGRFKMFFMIDPPEHVDEPMAAIPAAAPALDQAAETRAIAAALRQAVGADATIAPVAIAGDVAIAGWSTDRDAARALLRKRDGAWQVLMWSGPSLLLPSTMNAFGISATVADALRAQLDAGEAALGTGLTARFDSFSGTVVLK